MKNILLLENCCSPPELGHQVVLFVEHYNEHRCHEALNNVTLADVYLQPGWPGAAEAIPCQEENDADAKRAKLWSKSCLKDCVNV